MGRAKRRCRHARHQRGHHKCPNPAQRASQVTAASRSKHRLHRPKHHHQRQCRSKTHLKPGAQQAFGAAQQHQHRRKGNCPHGYRAPVHQHRHQHHRHHQERPFGGDICPGQQQIAKACDQCDGGRDFLDRPSQRDSGPKRKTSAQAGKDHASKQAHVQPGDGQKMRQIAGAQILGHMSWHMGAISGDERGCNAARPLRHRGAHPIGEPRPDGGHRQYLWRAAAQNRHPAIADRPKP